MRSSTAPVEQDQPSSEWEFLQPYTVRADREGASLEGDRRVSDRATLERLSKVHWEFDGSYYSG